MPKSRPSGKCSGKDDAEEHECDYGARISTLISMGLLTVEDGAQGGN